MANLIYTRFLASLANGTVDFDSGSTVLRLMLERSTSTYSPNKDHDFVSDLADFVEISASGYSRQNAASKAVNIDDANDRVELDLADLNFGDIAAGQTVKAIVGYIQTGGDDASPEDDILAFYIDTDAGALLPIATAGGAFEVTINAEGLIQLSQP